MASLTTKVFAAFTVIALMSISTTIVSFGAYSNSKTIQSSGTVTTINVGVYWDYSCTNATTTINWGSIAPGSSKTYNVYIKNEGSVSMSLSLTTDNWSPTIADNYISVTWNRQGAVISPNSVNSASITLSVSSTATGFTSFNFNTIITGTG